jgi:signal transduction histidine kinase/CheY-like chemotaxis protein
MRPRWRLFRQDAGRSAGPPPFVYLLLFVLSMAVGQWSIGLYGTVVVWPANGVLLAALLQLHRRDAIRLLAVCFVINLLGNALRGDQPLMLVLNAVLNFGEVLLAGLIARRFCGAALDMRRPARLVRFALLAVAPAVMVSMVIGVGVQHPAANEIVLDAENWFNIETLGLLTVTPTLLMLARGHRFTAFRREGGMLEPALMIAALVIVTTAVFAQSAAPVQFLVFAPLLLIAFRLSPSWSALSVIIVAVIGGAFTLNGHGPMTLNTLGPATWPRANLLPVLRALPVFHAFMAMVLCVSLPASTFLTERRRLEAKLRARTDAAVKARLHAEQAAGAKSRFLSMMSHEMRTPLNGVCGYAEILATSSDLGALAAGQVAQIRKSSDRLLNLVDEILDFSRGELDIVAAPFSLAAVIADAASEARDDAEAKGLTLTVSGGPSDADRHLGDARRLRQVLRHLLSNAVKFTERGGVDLSVHFDDQRAEITIRDSGPGISADMLAQLFQPFSQADASTTRAHEGAGIGLAVSRALAERLGGTLNGKNGPNGGAVFTFAFPLPVAEVPVAAPVEADEGRAPRILVVDDHQTNRDVAAVMLAAIGCETAMACDGLEAVAAVRDGDYDLVLMDVRMPNMDGLAATRSIRALPGKAATPIVAMTADAMPEDVTRCLAAGMNAHIAKPVTMAKLGGALERFLGDPEPAAHTLDERIDAA